MSEDLVRESLSNAMRDTALRASPDYDFTSETGGHRYPLQPPAGGGNDGPTGTRGITASPVGRCTYILRYRTKNCWGISFERPMETKANPGSFRIVLTPSCDMVDAGNQKPRVDRVLVANCCPMSEVLQKMGLQDAGATRLKDELPRRMLNQGYFQDFIPLPPLDSEIPAIAANLKDLDLIPIYDIGQDREYKTVASVDSPFREQVAWAYLQIIGRPGLPERDTSTWAQDIIQAVGK